MNKKKMQLIQSIVCVAIVVLVAIYAFLYRERIAQYASYGYWGLLIACIASTATILLPALRILAVLQYSTLLNPLGVIIIGGLGTSLGELIGYILRRKGTDIVTTNTNVKIVRWFNKSPQLAVFFILIVTITFI